MAKKHKRENRYTVLLVSDSPTDTPKQLHALPALCLSVAGVLVVIAGVFIGILIAQQHRLNTQQKHIDDLNNDIVIQNKHLKEVELENRMYADGVVSYNQVISDITAQKEAIEDEYRKLSQEVYELCIPSGCPVTGTATVPEKRSKPGKDGLVIFETYKNADIIATGNGTVTAINNLINDENGYTYEIVIDHGNEYVSYYYSKEIPLVVIGDEVDKASPLFHITQDNTSFGYKIMQNDKYINPWDMIEIYG